MALSFVIPKSINCQICDKDVLFTDLINHSCAFTADCYHILTNNSGTPNTDEEITDILLTIKITLDNQQQNQLNILSRNGDFVPIIIKKKVDEEVDNIQQPTNDLFKKKIITRPNEALPIENLDRKTTKIINNHNIPVSSSKRNDKVINVHTENIQSINDSCVIKTSKTFSNNKPQNGRMSAISGFQNLGNSCFMNHKKLDNHGYYYKNDNFSDSFPYKPSPKTQSNLSQTDDNQLLHAIGCAIHRRRITIAALLLQVISKNKGKVRKLKRRRRIWVRRYFEYRPHYGFFYTNFLLLKEDPEFMVTYTRMHLDQFYYILDLVRPIIQKQFCVREPITAEERLLLTLRYLAIGDAYCSLSFSFNISRSAISSIIPEVCQAIWDTLLPIVLKPCSTDDWKIIAEGFKRNRSFPNCVGAMDGKHIPCEALPNTGSEYYNYKGRHSIILLAIADSNYIFRVVDIGANGRQSDGGVYLRSSFFPLLETDSFNIPPPEDISASSGKVPFVLVGDSAFGLSHYLMTPYAESKKMTEDQKNYNNYHSLARKVVENTFGILAARWRIFRRAIDLKTHEHIIKVVQAAVCLHNFLRLEDLNAEKPTYLTESLLKEVEEQDIIDITNANLLPLEDNMYLSINRNKKLTGEKIRKLFTKYFKIECNIKWNQTQHQ